MTYDEFLLRLPRPARIAVEVLATLFQCALIFGSVMLAGLLFSFVASIDARATEITEPTAVYETIPEESVPETITETIPETTPATIPETTPATTPAETIPQETIVQVIEVTETADYAAQLQTIIDLLQTSAEANVYVFCFLLFFVVVLLCYFAYKFLRIFI